MNSTCVCCACLLTDSMLLDGGTSIHTLSHRCRTVHDASTSRPHLGEVKHTTKDQDLQIGFCGQTRAVSQGVDSRRGTLGCPSLPSTLQ